MTLSRPSQAGGESGVEGRTQAPVSLPSAAPRIWNESDFRAPPAEALASPAIVWVRHDQIDGDPFNIRQSLPSVQRLCWSIYQHGLLENLVAKEHPRRAQTGKLYELRAGSRRFEAIRRLIEGVEPPPGHPDRDNGVLWTWPAERPVPLLIVGSEGHYEHLVENIERSPPEAWEVGRRVDEILSAGVSSRELGTRLGRSNGWVNRYAHIGRGLAPELIEILRREHADLKLGDLGQLASIRDKFGDPDAERQIEAFRARKAKRRRRPRRIDPHSFQATIKRLQYLRSDMPVPSILRPIVSAVLEYLEGGVRPPFRDLEATVFEQVRVFSPHTPEET